MDVTPFVGVWIEMIPGIECTGIALVTPFVGVWIEIPLPAIISSSKIIVTPFVGVWIEIAIKSEVLSTFRHSLRGSVD